MPDEPPQGSAIPAERRLEIDFSTFPAGRCRERRMDVPLNGPLGTLKQALRRMLREFESVKSASLLVCSSPDWGDAAHLIVLLAADLEVRPLYRAWNPYSDKFPPVGFMTKRDRPLATFASLCALPFYTPGHRLPGPFSRAELIEHLRSLPDLPLLAGYEAHLESLKESHDDLPPEVAAAEYRAQQLEFEDALSLARSQSNHHEAKEQLLRHLTQERPFGLYLRTFASEATVGVSAMTGGRGLTQRADQPMQRLLARLSPLPLFGIANGMHPSAGSDVLMP